MMLLHRFEITRSGSADASTNGSQIRCLKFAQHFSESKEAPSRTGPLSSVSPLSLEDPSRAQMFNNAAKSDTGIKLEGFFDRARELLCSR